MSYLTELTVDSSHRVRPLLADDPELLGDYRLVGRLGSGGMGVVYLAEAPDGNHVAVKQLHSFVAVDPDLRERFRSEINRARQVPSFCTAEILDSHLDHEPPYLVAEYVDGPSLAEVVAERGPLTPASLQSMAVGVAAALAGIHAAGVIHRDLKPQNVLLPPGNPKVIDFGIARSFELTTPRTRADQFVGTVAYTAPERFGSELDAPLTAAADIFSWGCVVGYAATGHNPFHGDSPSVTATRILTQPPHLGGLAQPLRGLVEIALAKDPADRPTAHQLLDLLVSGRGAPRPPAHAAPEEVNVPLRRSLPAVDLPAAVAAPLSMTPDAASSDTVISAPAHTRPAGHVSWLTTAAALVALVGVTLGAFLFARSDLFNSVPRAGSPHRSQAAAVAPPSSGAAAGAADVSELPSGAPAGEGGSSGYPAARPEPTGGRPIIQAKFSEPGDWFDSEIRQESASCFIRTVMRATRIDPGIYQCVGPEKAIKGDFGVEVTTSLVTAGGCAAIWFHWDDAEGGHVARVCHDEISTAAESGGDSQALGRIELPEPIVTGEPTRIHMTVRGRTVDFWRNGDFVGTVRLPADGRSAGQVRLGISVQQQDDPPPYTVGFYELDIRSIGLG